MHNALQRLRVNCHDYATKRAVFLAFKRQSWLGKSLKLIKVKNETKAKTKIIKILRDLVRIKRGLNRLMQTLNLRQSFQEIYKYASLVK